MLETNPEPACTANTEFQAEPEQLSESKRVDVVGRPTEVIRLPKSDNLSDAIRLLEADLVAGANPFHNIIPMRDSMFRPEAWHPYLTVTRQASLLDVSRTGAYQAVQKIKSEASITISLMHRIDALYTAYPYYGSRRMVAALFREGVVVNRKRVQRLMRAMGIEAMYPGPNLSKRLQATFCRPYLLRHLDINRTNQVWGIDFTYIRMGKGFMFLFVIIDWFSRRIVDYELSSTIGKEVAIQCLERAFTKKRPEIINSDQGSQFTNADYLALIAANDIKVSMDGKGRARDNARTERFFRSLKYERIYLNEYDSPQHLRRSINEYVDYYNTVRPHQSNDYMTPEEMYAVGSAGLVA
jgi:putative transposase